MGSILNGWLKLYDVLFPFFTNCVFEWIICKATLNAEAETDWTLNKKICVLTFLSLIVWGDVPIIILGETVFLCEKKHSILVSI